MAFDYTGVLRTVDNRVDVQHVQLTVAVQILGVQRPRAFVAAPHQFQVFLFQQRRNQVGIVDRSVHFVEKRVKPHVAFRAVAMFASVDDVVNALDFVARRATVVDAQAFGSDMLFGQVFGRAAIHARLVRFNKLQILAQNARPAFLTVAQFAESLFDKTVMIPLRRRVVARFHRAFGDDLGVLVKDQVLDRMDFLIGHGEVSFWLNYLASVYRINEVIARDISERL